MDQDKLERVVMQAVDDLARGDIRRARDRLRSVIQLQPDHEAALTLLGQIYYNHGNYRNAVMYWSQAGMWDDDARTAYRKVFTAAGRALNHRNLRMARYYLHAFDCAETPDDLRGHLDALHEAHYSLIRMESRQMLRTCAPQCGAVMLALIGISTLLLGLGWSWFIWMGALAVLATALVSAGNRFSYYTASTRFRKAMQRAASHGRR